MISRQIKAFTNKKGISQAELAKRLGLDRSYLNKIYLGKKKPSDEMTKKITQYIKDND